MAALFNCSEEPNSQAGLTSPLLCTTHGGRIDKNMFTNALEQ